MTASADLEGDLQTERWKAKVLSEIEKSKGDYQAFNPIEELSYEIEDNVTCIHPVVDFALPRNDNNWKNCFICKAEEEKQTNNKLLSALMNGAEVIQILVANPKTQWNLLFEAIEFKYIETFICLRNLETLHSFCQWYKQEENTKACIDLFDFKEEEFEEVFTLLKNVPSIFQINGFEFQQCGANARQEIGIILSQTNELLLLQKSFGIEIPIRIEVGIGSDFMIEIAKLRSLKYLVNRIFDDHHLNRNSVHFNAQIGWTNKSLSDLHTNQLRQTTEALSAVLAGVDYLSIPAYDIISTSGSSILSQRMAINISHLLKEEAQVRFIDNPFNNSFAIENLSYKLAALAWQTFQELDGYAIWLNAEKLEKIQDLIKPIRALKIKSFKENKIQLIGINIFKNPKEDKKDWEEEGLFLEMEKLRFDKIERHEN